MTDNHADPVEAVGFRWSALSGQAVTSPVALMLAGLYDYPRSRTHYRRPVAGWMKEVGAAGVRQYIDWVRRTAADARADGRPPAVELECLSDLAEWAVGILEGSDERDG